MDADGYYSDSTGIHLTVDDLTIFRSQYNIGRRIVETVQKAAVLDLNDNHQPDGKKKFQDINLLFLGPTYKTLRNQTKKDLGNFLQERVNIPHSQIVKICESRVLNSSAVPDNYEDMPFIKVLRQNPEHFLHILVFDEAHWGISSGSIIDRFFQYLAKLRKDIINKKKFKPSLIILLVSATIDVFTRVIHRYANGALRVDWSALRLSDRKKFGTPQYLDINKLYLCNDTNPNLLRHTTMAQRSSFVVAEYSETIKTCLETVFRLQNKNWKNNATWQALQFLLPGDTNDEIADRVSAVDYAPEHNYIVLLRLQLNQHVTDLYNDILKTFRTISTKINKNVRPFEVIQLIQDSDSILKQLSPKAKRHLHLDDQIVEDDLVVSKLYNLPCLILVNDKLGMGERLPSSCMAFDVRSRYKGDAADMKGFACTFIQDIGRCCGHMKPPARVLMSITNKDYRGSGEIGQLTLEDVKFSQLHSLLTKTQSAAAAHPERHAKAFSELSSSSIILDAEPQIGKTGAIMSMLDILYSEHTSLSKVSPFPSTATASYRTTIQSNSFEEITAQLCRIVNDPDETLDTRIRQLKTTLGTDDLFQCYHDMIGKSKEVKDLSESIFNNSLIAPMNAARKAKQNVFSIVDCGCGLHGILDMFLENSSDLDLPAYIIGIDLHEIIRQLHPNKPVPNITFISHVGDMASTDKAVTKSAPFNVVLYSLSLFENDITRHINWANRQLKMGGILIIADVIRRFSDDFEKSVKKCGFKCRSPYKICDLFQVWTFEKESNMIDETQTVQLKPY